MFNGAYLPAPPTLSTRLLMHGRGAQPKLYSGKQTASLGL